MNNRRLSPSRRIRRERGIVLFIALGAIVVMSLAAVALIRSYTTANTISGNLAFQQATTMAADVGVELAFNAMPAILAASLEQNVANQYFALQQAVDANGIPATITWASVPCRDAAAAAQPLVSCADESVYRVQYVIDRQCTGGLPVTDISRNCLVDAPKSDGSKAAGQTVFSAATRVMYRVTVRVLGPRGTTSLVQAVMAF